MNSLARVKMVLDRLYGKPDVSLISDLLLDSLSTLEFIMQLESTFEIEINDVEFCHLTDDNMSVEELVVYLDSIKLDAATESSHQLHFTCG